MTLAYIGVTLRGCIGVRTALFGVKMRQDLVSKARGSRPPPTPWFRAGPNTEIKNLMKIQNFQNHRYQ